MGGLLSIEKIFQGDIQIGEEISFSAMYGMYIVSVPTMGVNGIYSIGSYVESLVAGFGRMGDWSTGTEGVIFGRKETNGALFLKNNSDYAINVSIRKYSAFSEI